MGARKIEAYDIQENEELSIEGKNENVCKSEHRLADVFELDKKLHAKGNLVFNKPEHYFDSDSDEKQTRISVVDKHGEKEINQRELESYLTQNKKINRIVIEEVKANDVKRTNLIFDSKKKARSKEPIYVDAASIEARVNKEFIANTHFSKGNSLKSEFEEAVALLGQLPNQKPRSKSSSKTEKVQAEMIDDIDFGTSAKKAHAVEVVEVEPKAKEDASEEIVFANLSMGEESEKSSKERTAEVEISRHEFRRKNNKSLSKLYYKVKNHIELFKLGDSYLRDFNRGIKSLAFNSTGVKGEREKTVLGVTSFLNYNAKVTVTVVTDDLQKSLYHNYIKDLEEIKKPILNEDIQYTCYGTQGVEFVEFSEICDVMYQLGNSTFEEFIENFVESSDVVLWDLPDLKEMDNKKEVFYPVIRSLESVSLIVKTNYSKYAELHKIKDYFEKYKVPFKGLVLAE